MPKRSLRLKLLAQRRALSHDMWCASSSAAQLNLLSLDEYVRAECIALYAPANNETDTVAIFYAALHMGKRVLYPVVSGNQLLLRRVERIEVLQGGTFGILEPCPTGIDFHADEPDLIVVPGVVFDLKGHRIGYGKGFYDRFLHHPACRADMVGLCHDFQLTDETISTDTHDIPMKIIVSDKRIMRIPRLVS
jgi:5-formyltetrahydrofolate cyclo-ligase